MDRPPVSERRVARAAPDDRIFFGLSIGSAALIMVILAGGRALPDHQGDAGDRRQLADQPDLAGGTTAGHDNFWGYVGPLVWGTRLGRRPSPSSSALRSRIGIALFISHYAPRRLAGILGYLVDLLAAVPSVVFGLWGIFVIRPFLLPLEHWLNAQPRLDPALRRHRRPAPARRSSPAPSCSPS